MKTMSDFIMEQEITTSSANDDMEIMEGFMKMNAIASIAECYCEHAAIAQFATEEGLSVFSESDDNIVKRAWNATKEFFEKIWEWLKALVRSILNIFTKSKIDKVIAKLKSRDADEELNISAKALAVTEVLEFIDQLDGIVKDANEGKKVDGDVKALQELLDAFNKEGKEKNAGFSHGDKWGKSDTTVGACLDTLEALNAAGIPTRGSKLLKKLGFDKKKVTNGGEDVDKDTVKKIKKLASGIAKAYDKYYNATVKIVDKALGEKIKQEKLDNRIAANDSMKDTAEARKDGRKNFGKETQESYAENSDGYFFL